jgi:hypothetical protein
MKNIYKIFFGLGLVGLTYSCTDLEEELVGDLQSDFTIEGISTGAAGGSSDALQGAFSAVRNAGTANHGGYFSVQSVSTDEMAVTQKGGDWYDGGIWLQMHRHTFTPSNGPLNGTWIQQYEQIAQVNNVIANGSLDAGQMAQAKVVRAYLHWRLMDLYGRIPIVTGPSTKTAQLPRAEAFAWIVKEITDALPLLGTADVKYRINQYAAHGLLAKLYLNAEVYTGTAQWAKAAEHADFVIENGPYRLSDDTVKVPNLGRRPSVSTDPVELSGYAAVFSPTNENNPEIIWSIEYDEATAGGMNFNQMTLHYASQYSWNFQAQPWNGYSALEEFYNSYENGDKRKAANFIVGPQLDYGGNALVDLASDNADPAINYVPNINELEPNANRIGGARLGKFSFQQFGRPDMNNDYPIVRLGDMYLIRAEALARDANDWSKALPDVNTIRARAGVAAMTSITADQFLAERGREMFQEASRRTDLIRFGKWGATWWEKTNSDAYRTVFPIPAEQIQVSGGTLTQNPGYN